MTSSPDPVRRRVHEALALRGWALGALCGAGGAAPHATAGAWRTFLRAERCGLALLARGEAALGSGAAIVRARATVESQRMLSAAAQLRAAGTTAAREGWTLMVLKGGVPLAEGRTGADLVDVDVLAAPDDARALERSLDAAGYTARGRASSHRLQERAAPDAVQVEIHTAIPGIPGTGDVLSRSVPTRFAGLRAPHPADHLWHLLIHTVAQHTGRRGALREIVVLADALGRCTPDDVAAARARMAARRDGPALLAQLELARAVRDRRPPAADPFRAVAAGMYLAAERLGPSRLPPALKSGIAEAAFVAIARRDGTAPAPHDTGAGLDQGGAVGRLLRRVPLWLFTPPALLLARAAERAAREG